MLYALALLALAAFSHAKNLPLTAEGAAVVEYTGTKMDYSSEKRMLEVWSGWPHNCSARAPALAAPRARTRCFTHLLRTLLLNTSCPRAPAASQNELRAPSVSHLPRILACRFRMTRPMTRTTMGYMSL